MFSFLKSLTKKHPSAPATPEDVQIDEASVNVTDDKKNHAPETVPKDEASRDVTGDKLLVSEPNDALNVLIPNFDDIRCAIQMGEEVRGNQEIGDAKQINDGKENACIGSDNVKETEEIGRVTHSEEILVMEQEVAVEQSHQLAQKRRSRSTNDGNETPKKKLKALSTEHGNALNKAMVLKINDETCNKDSLSNEEYLRTAGYPTGGINKSIVSYFKTLYCRIKKSIIIPRPIHRQPYHNHWVKVQSVTTEMMQFFPIALNILENGVAPDYNFIGETNIQQVQLSLMDDRRRPINVNGNKINVKEAIGQLIRNSKEYFSAVKWSNCGVDLEKIIIHGLFTDGKTIKFQRPHTDYTYLTKTLDPTAQVTTGEIAGVTKGGRKQKGKKNDTILPTTKKGDLVATKTSSSSKSLSHLMYSWTAHMPLTEDGMWINLWFGPGYGHAVYVPYGETLFLRSDMIHGGGVPMSVEAKGLKKYYRLHFYLPTDFQPAYPGQNNYDHYDNVTHIPDICLLPETSFDSKKIS
jgi:hypothetical protein